VDFSENYSSQYQDEVQSAHWHYSQVTVFICVVWVKNVCNNYVIVSDMSHGKFAMYKFLQVIMDDLKACHPGIEDFYSDEAASQFKQKYLFDNLTFLKEAHAL